MGSLGYSSRKAGHERTTLWNWTVSNSSLVLMLILVPVLFLLRMIMGGDWGPVQSARKTAVKFHVYSGDWNGTTQTNKNTPSCEVQVDVFFEVYVVQTA